MKQPSWAGSIEASAPDPVEDLLLLRGVDTPERLALAGHLLDEGLGSRSWRNHGVAVWDLYDPSDPASSSR